MQRVFKERQCPRSRQARTGRVECLRVDLTVEGLLHAVELPEILQATHAREPRLFAGKDEEDTVRAWIAGCAKTISSRFSAVYDLTMRMPPSASFPFVVSTRPLRPQPRRQEVIAGVMAAAPRLRAGTPAAASPPPDPDSPVR